MCIACLIGSALLSNNMIENSMPLQSTIRHLRLYLIVGAGRELAWNQNNNYFKIGVKFPSLTLANILISEQIQGCPVKRAGMLIENV